MTVYRAAVCLLIATFLAAGVAGCGVRGSLESPDRQSGEKTATAESGQGKKEGEAPKPHRSFVLDGLLR